MKPSTSKSAVPKTLPSPSNGRINAGTLAHWADEVETEPRICVSI